ncbi:hypothetical protein LOAG_01326 [Loa loa]|uniref:Uncharacterized protein n=1 Tax=Loa loa TaxID=7209 RepID=A0A1S0U9Y0_LOALO|nr:hypothetical protein LOAG_01326 [Loa loa]EFO27152.2 hypothetical protein LOAG_01326 [Loa loa]
MLNLDIPYGVFSNNSRNTVVMDCRSDDQDTCNPCLWRTIGLTTQLMYTDGHIVETIHPLRISSTIEPQITAIFAYRPPLDSKPRYSSYSLNTFPVAYPQLNDISINRQSNYYRRQRQGVC